MPIDRIFTNIQKSLVSHGARQIMFSYNDDGTAEGITFMVMTPQGTLPVRLPARINQVEMILYGTNDLDEKRKMQAYRTGWKNIHDWVDAQMALLETGMVKIEEVFLPYIMVSKDVSMFQKLEGSKFLLPE